MGVQITIRDVPVAVRDDLAARAARERKSMQEYLKQELERLAARPSLHERVWSLRKNVTSHDAWYMAVAEAFDAPLSTLDRALERSTGPTCRFRMPG